LKKGIVILLLICLVAPFTGTYLYYHYKKNQVRKEVAAIIKNNLSEKTVTVFKLTAEEVTTRINWKRDCEFEYNGHMYDVVDQHPEGDLVVFTCYKDRKETSLNRKKERLIAKAFGQDPAQKNHSERIENFFNTVFRKDVFAWNAYQPQASIFHFSFFTFHFSLFTQAPPSPPPKYS
jgi:hypothetical protein